MGRGVVIALDPHVFQNTKKCLKKLTFFFLYFFFLLILHLCRILGLQMVHNLLTTKVSILWYLTHVLAAFILILSVIHHLMLSGLRAIHFIKIQTIII